MARVAAHRSAHPQEPTTDPRVPQQSGLVEDGDDEVVPEEDGTTVPEEDRDV